MNRPEPEKLVTHPIASTDVKAWEDFPNIRSFFTALRYEGTESAREPGLMMVSLAASGWQMTLKDSTAASMLKLQAQTWDELVLLAEIALGDKRAAWIPDQWARTRARKR